MLKVDNIEITHEGVEEEEVSKCLDQIMKHAPKGTTHISVSIDGEELLCKYEFIENKPFERIRRITGYLVGTMDRWNDAKRSEEHDRVKHTV